MIWLEILLIVIVIMIITSIISIIEYSSQYDKFLYNVRKLSTEQMKLLNLKECKTSKDMFYRNTYYSYKDIMFQVTKNRYTFTKNMIHITILKNDRKICNYSQLSKKFKTQFYKQYLKARYPKTIGRIMQYESTNILVNKKLEKFFKDEGVLEIVHERI